MKYISRYEAKPERKRVLMKQECIDFVNLDKTVYMPVCICGHAIKRDALDIWSGPVSAPDRISLSDSTAAKAGAAPTAFRQIN